MFNINNVFHVEYILVGMLAVILYLLYYVYSKDVQYNKNIRSVASVVEELNREIWHLKKNLTQTQQDLQKNSRGMSDDEMYEEIERTVYDMVQPISSTIQQMKDNILAIETQVDSRVSSIENGVKQFSIPSSIHGNDDEKVISLFKQGIPLETISKELHISKPEVEFVLKINQLK